MSFSRRDFIKLMTVASAAGFSLSGLEASKAGIKKISNPGNVEPSV